MHRHPSAPEACPDCNGRGEHRHSFERDEDGGAAWDSDPCETCRGMQVVNGCECCEVQYGGFDPYENPLLTHPEETVVLERGEGPEVFCAEHMIALFTDWFSGAEMRFVLVRRAA